MSDDNTGMILALLGVCCCCMLSSSLAAGLASSSSTTTPAAPVGAAAAATEPPPPLPPPPRPAWGLAAAAAAPTVPSGMITGKTVQVARADNKAEWMNLLGIDVFDQSGARITTGITPTITPAVYASDPNQYGPQYLIDGIHAESGASGMRLPHSTNDPNSAMTLDLGADKVISKIVIYNRTACCSDRINGCNLVVKKADGTAVLTIPLTGAKAIYTFSAPLTNTSTSSTYTPEPYNL